MKIAGACWDFQLDGSWSELNTGEQLSPIILSLFLSLQFSYKHRVLCIRWKFQSTFWDKIPFSLTHCLLKDIARKRESERERTRAKAKDRESDEIRMGVSHASFPYPLMSETVRDQRLPLSVNRCSASICLASSALLHYMIKHGWPSQIYKYRHTHTLYCLVIPPLSPQQHIPMISSV